MLNYLGVSRMRAHTSKEMEGGKGERGMSKERPIVGQEKRLASQAENVNGELLKRSKQMEEAAPSKRA
jgi:hypothetical protein